MSTMFQKDETPAPERAFPTTAVAIATAAILILVTVLILLGRRHTPALNAELPLAPYAPQLVIDGIQMSESTSLSGGKSTYIDGRITNGGPSTVTGVTVQVFFRNDEAMPPQVETTPLMLVRAREPYIDTEMVAADPLAPGASHDFRLTFEGIKSNWNQSLPDIHITSAATK